MVNSQTSSEFAHYLLGHSIKSPYLTEKESVNRLRYATKIMPFVTFINYSKLEQDASVKQSEVESLMMKDANKDREIELLKQKLQIKDKEIELLKHRDSIHTDAEGSLSDIVMQLKEEVDKLKRDKNNLTANSS
jgi:hypothetical protein